MMDLAVIEKETGVRFGQKLFWLNIIKNLSNDDKPLIQIEQDRSGVFKIAVDWDEVVYVESSCGEFETLGNSYNLLTKDSAIKYIKNRYPNAYVIDNTLRNEDIQMIKVMYYGPKEDVHEELVKATCNDICKLLSTTQMEIMGEDDNHNVGICVKDAGYDRGQFRPFNRVMKDKDGKDKVIYGGFIVCKAVKDPKTGLLTLGSID